jgi:hypothetical protein
MKAKGMYKSMRNMNAKFICFRNFAQVTTTNFDVKAFSEVNIDVERRILTISTEDKYLILNIFE